MQNTNKAPSEHLLDGKPYKSRHTRRVVLATGLAVILTAFGVSWYELSRLTSIAQEHEQIQVAGEAEVAAQLIHERMLSGNRLVLSLSRSVGMRNAVLAIEHQKDGKSFIPDQEIRQYVEKWFSSLAEGDKRIIQLRLISTEGEGTELARVNSVSGLPNVVPRGEFQAKGHYAYVREAAALSEGEVFTSNFEFNREYGKIAEPSQIVVRYSTPVYVKDETRPRAVIVANMDASALLVPDREGVVMFDILDHSGRYILSQSREHLGETPKSYFGRLSPEAELLTGVRPGPGEIVVTPSHNPSSGLATFRMDTDYQHQVLTVHAQTKSSTGEILQQAWGTRTLLGVIVVTLVVGVPVVIAVYAASVVERKRVERLVGAIHDRNEAQLALRASERMVDQLMIALDSSCIVAMTDGKGKINFVNDNFCKISGFTREELIGQDHRMINSGYHPKGFFVDMYAKITAGETWRQEVCNRAKDGSLYWVDTTVVPMLDDRGKPQRYIALRIDITNRKKADQEILELAHRLTTATKAAHMGIWAYTPADESLIWDDEMHSIYGTNPSTAEGLYSLWFDALHPDDKEQAEKQVVAALAADGNAFDTYFRIIRGDGEVRYIRAYATVRRDRFGKAIQMIGANFDITDRMQQQQARDRMTSELDHRVKNTLAMVLAMADQTAMTTKSQKEFLKAFDARIRTLSSAHEALALSKWQGLDLKLLVERAVLSLAGNHRDNIRCIGPELVIPATGSTPLALVLGELTTNAIKHGSLSVPSGTLDLHWTIQDNGELEISWRESGGPVVIGTPANAGGLGLDLIRGMVTHDLGGQIEMNFQPDGLEVVFGFSVRSLGSTDELTASPAS